MPYCRDNLLKRATDRKRIDFESVWPHSLFSAPIEYFDGWWWYSLSRQFVSIVLIPRSDALREISGLHHSGVRVNLTFMVAARSNVAATVNVRLSFHSNIINKQKVLQNFAAFAHLYLWQSANGPNETQCSILPDTVEYFTSIPFSVAWLFVTQPPSTSKFADLNLKALFMGIEKASEDIRKIPNGRSPAYADL